MKQPLLMEFFKIFALGLWHYIASYLCSALMMSLLDPKEKTSFGKSLYWKFFPFCVLNVGSLCLLNLSLATSSVAVYQLAKMLTVPMTVVAAMVFFGRKFSRQVLAALVVMSLGIVLAIGSRAKTDLRGILFAAVAVLLVSLSLQSGELQKRYKVHATVLNYKTLPVQIVLLACAAAVFEPLYSANSILYFTWTVESVFCVLMTTVFAVILNVTVVFSCCLFLGLLSV